MCAVDEDESVARTLFRRALTAYVTVPQYNNFFREIGYEKEATIAIDSWNAGDRKKALETIPDEMVEKIFVFGTAEKCRRRLDDYAKAGITTTALQFSSFARSPEERRAKVLKANRAAGSRYKKKRAPPGGDGARLSSANAREVRVRLLHVTERIAEAAAQASSATVGLAVSTIVAAVVCIRGRSTSSNPPSSAVVAVVSVRRRRIHRLPAVRGCTPAGSCCRPALHRIHRSHPVHRVHRAIRRRQARRRATTAERPSILYEQIVGRRGMAGVAVTIVGIHHALRRATSVRHRIAAAVRSCAVCRGDVCRCRHVSGGR